MSNNDLPLGFWTIQGLVQRDSDNASTKTKQAELEPDKFSNAPDKCIISYSKTAQRKPLVSG